MVIIVCAVSGKVSVKRFDIQDMFYGGILRCVGGLTLLIQLLPLWQSVCFKSHGVANLI